LKKDDKTILENNSIVIENENEYSSEPDESNNHIETDNNFHSNHQDENLITNVEKIEE